MATKKFYLIYTNKCAIIKKTMGGDFMWCGSPVDVISMCSTDGTIRPLRLRMEDEEHQLLRIDIEEVISSKDSTA